VLETVASKTASFVNNCVTISGFLVAHALLNAPKSDSTSAWVTLAHFTDCEGFACVGTAMTDAIAKALKTNLFMSFFSFC
jgi:hypothetical protein